MKTAASEKTRTTGSVRVNLDPYDSERIATLATAKKRTPHNLIKEAIHEYVQREEMQQNLIKSANSSSEPYKETGLLVSLGEFIAWIDEAQQSSDSSIAACHM